MSNQERREARYQRRQKLRKEKREKFLNSIPSYEEVFTFENLWTSFWLCRKEVGWKPSIQMYQQNLTIELVELLNELHSDAGFHSRGFIEFNICERGKMRHIKSVDIKERVVQRCFCDYYLIPLLTRNLIYDNGASLKNKGIDFSLKRLEKHLNNYYKKYKTAEGFILIYDFSNYFGNINHKKLYSVVDTLIRDDKCKKLYHRLVDAFGDIGLGLGSQVSQISAIIFPNQMDHLIANELTADSSARYMDDGYIIFHNIKDAKKFTKKLLKMAFALNIQLNPKKIKICKLNKTFTYLKKRFYLTNNGVVIVRLNYKNVFKHRRRIKKLLKLVLIKKLILHDLIISHTSWLGQIKKYKNRKSVYNIDNQIRRLFNERQRNNSNLSSY